MLFEAELPQSAHFSPPSPPHVGPHGHRELLLEAHLELRDAVARDGEQRRPQQHDECAHGVAHEARRVVAPHAQLDVVAAVHVQPRIAAPAHLARPAVRPHARDGGLVRSVDLPRRNDGLRRRLPLDAHVRVEVAAVVDGGRRGARRSLHGAFARIERGVLVPKGVPVALVALVQQRRGQRRAHAGARAAVAPTPAAASAAEGRGAVRLCREEPPAPLVVAVVRVGVVDAQLGRVVLVPPPAPRAEAHAARAVDAQRLLAVRVHRDGGREPGELSRGGERREGE